MPQHLVLLFCLMLFSTGFGQALTETHPPENIKTIVFKGPTEDQFPIIKLGEPIQLTFDDLTAREDDYYYKLVHCNYDWTPSNLLKSQYLEGMDNQRIMTYENSYNTLQPFSHYTLRIPNRQVRLLLSGNYLLEVYNYRNQLQFSRRFVVYEDLAPVGVVLKNTRDFNHIQEQQVVQFTINTARVNIPNPQQDVKVAIVQNYHWPSALYNIKPQYLLGKELVYKYDAETRFWGGNEYLNFDTKDLRSPSSSIARVSMEALYHHYLFTDRYRRFEPYTYFPDINGDFVIRTLQGSDPNREAEYTQVHFSLPFTNSMGMGDVYVVGRFNNYVLDESNKMTFNDATGLFELTLKIKQGFYNYKYVLQDENGNFDPNWVGGNFNFTENNYLVLVYFRKFGELYDSLIGIGSGNSSTISN